MMWDLWWGPTPVDEGLHRCDEFLQRTSSKRTEATALLIGGSLKAAQGRLQEGRDDEATARLILHELGNPIWWAGASMVLGETELWAGAVDRAYELLAEGHTRLAESSKRGTSPLSSVCARRRHSSSGAMTRRSSSQTRPNEWLHRTTSSRTRAAAWFAHACWPGKEIWKERTG